MMFMKIWNTIIQQRKRTVLMVFDDMIADMESNKKLSPVFTELFFKRQKTQYFTRFYLTILFQGA